MSEKYRYELSLTVHDHGRRTFSAASDGSNQGDLASSLSFDIARMFTILNDPPGAIPLAADVAERRGVCGLLGELHRAWTGVNGLEDALTITVDIAALTEEGDLDAADMADRLAQRFGRLVRFVNVPKGGEP